MELQFEASVFNQSGDMISLEVLLDGVTVTSVDLQDGTSSYYIDVEIEDGNTPLLSLRFAGGPDDSVTFNSFEIGGAALNLNSDLTSFILSQNQSTHINYIGGDSSGNSSHGDDIITGSSGNDTIGGRGGSDTIYGGAGDDILKGQGEADIDYLYGEAGNDTLYGGPGDELYGGDGNDVLRAHGGTGILDGGNDIDQVWWRDATAAMTIDLAAGTATDGAANVATVLNIENVIGSSYDDTITGDDNDNSLYGGDGSDTIYGGAGNDDLRGQGPSAEVDYLYGEAGNDILYGGLNDELYGGDGDDILRAIGGTGILDGGNDNDLIWWRNASGSMTIDLGAGTATDAGGDIATFLNVERFRGGSFADTIIGDDNDNILDGGIDFGGNIDLGDTIEGRGGNDTIFGRSGDDFLYGGQGSDTIYGGAGNDTIVAGEQSRVTVTNIGDIVSYGGSQDSSGTISLLDDNVGFVMNNGNSWKQILDTYVITSNTVLEFDFRVTSGGEIHGIGFDIDNGITANRTFQLYGSQNWGNRTFDYTDFGNWQHFEIDVGSFFTGTFSRMTFANDHDSGANSNNYFANIILYESDQIDGTNNLYASDGTDDLYGDTGIDHFIFENTNGIDNLHYFTESDGDVLNLSDILSFSSGSITDYVSLSNSGDHMSLGIDVNGTASFTTIAEIRGVNDLDVATLYANGQIIA